MVYLFRRILACVAIAVLFVSSVITTTQAEPGFMLVGGLTSQPIGHYEFCKRLPNECNTRMRDPGPLKLTDAIWNQMTAVNEAVNKAVQPVSDLDLYGKDEYWTYPNGAGDCEDYALEKRRALMQRGISLADLLITVLRKADGEGHAVLTVRTDRGDYILDNLNAEILTWNKTGYRYLKRQSSEHTGRWVSIQGGDQTLVGSVSK